MTRTSATLTGTVAAVMSRPVATVGLGATLRELAEALAAEEVGAAVVVAGDRFVGVVSERDVTTHLADGAHPDHLLVEEMVTTTPVTVSPGDSLQRAGQAMREAGVRHLPVVDAERGVVGMLSVRDVLGALLDTGAPALPG